MSSRRPWIGALGLACLVLAILLPSPASAAGTAPATGVVAASGTTLTVNGKPWRFVGYNMPCAQPFLLTTAQLSYVLAGVADNSGANAIRVWFFQKNGGPGNWGPFDRLVAAAQADGIRLIPTLVNEWPTCEANPPITIQKTLAWYQGGYKVAGDGYPMSFRNFAVAVAQHFANNPTIAFWQLVNEATAPTLTANGQLTCDETAAAHALRSFGDDMTDAIHAVDPNHLVSLGTQTGGQCGTSGPDYSYIHAGAVDLCEFHDYDYSYLPIGADKAPDGLAATLHACQALGKPFFVGESGVVPNVQPPPATQPLNCGPWPACTPTPVTYATLALRASIFKEKITDAFASGVSGYLIWFKGANYSAANDSYAIGDGDPTEAMMAGLSLGPTTAATIPPIVKVAASSGHHHGSWTDSPILLVVGGAVLILIWIGMWRSRRRA
jgi:mannan endo-1,4-beta-mannosidase